MPTKEEVSELIVKLMADFDKPQWNRTASLLLEAADTLNQMYPKTEVVEQCNCDQALELMAREAKTIELVKKCFTLPECTEGFQLVTDTNYNVLVAHLNS